MEQSGENVDVMESQKGKRKREDEKSVIKKPKKESLPVAVQPAFEEIILPEGNSWLRQYRKLPQGLCWSRNDFERVWNLHPAELGTVKIYGKILKTPRYQVSYESDYHFSGLDHKALPFPDEPCLRNEKEWVQSHEPELKCNQMLINFYELKTHCIGWHSDDERQLVPNSPVYSFSRGATRRFMVRSKSCKDKNSPTITLVMPNNSCIIMGGETQKYYKHRVPPLGKREEKKNPEMVGRRINSTYRFFLVK